MERGTSILFYLLFFLGEGKRGIFSSCNGSSSLSYGEKLCTDPPPSRLIRNYVAIHLPLVWWEIMYWSIWRGPFHKRECARPRLTGALEIKWGMGSRGLINPKSQTLNPSKASATSKPQKLVGLWGWLFLFFQNFRTMGIKYSWFLIYTHGSQHFQKKKGQIPDFKISVFMRPGSSLRGFQMIYMNVHV